MDILKKILPFSGIVIFIFILWKGIDLKSLTVVFSHINIRYLVPAVFFTFAIIFLKVIRLYNILKENSVEITFINLLEIYSNANILSQVTNLLFSETTAAVATMQKQNSKTRIANIYFLCNITDFTVILFLCIVSLSLNYRFVINLISFDLKGYYNLIIVSSVAVCFLLLIFLIFYKKILSVIKKILFDLSELFKNSSKTLAVLTFFVYIAYVTACYFDALTFNIKIDFFYLVFVYTLGSLISVIPISVNGLGTREAVFIFLMNIKGILNESSFALSIFAFVLAPLLILFLFYVFVMFKKRLLKFK